MQRLFIFIFSLFLIGLVFQYPLSFSEAEKKTEKIQVSEKFLITKEGVILPISFIENSKNKIEAIITAYSPLETDETPYETAAGTIPKEGKTVANNFLPLGTLIKIPEIFGEEILIVEDRMNSRIKGNRFDVFFENQQKAIEFGIKKTYVEILD